RAHQHAHSIQVIGCPCHDVARSRALVEAVREALKMAEQIVAQVEFDLSRYPDKNPACQVLENSFDGCYRQQHCRVSQKLVPGHTEIQIVDGLPNDERKEYPHAVVHQHAQRPDNEGRAVLAQVREQWLQILEHEKGRYLLTLALAIKHETVR